MVGNPQISRSALFQAELLAARRDRAARLGFSGGADFLHQSVTDSVTERLSMVTREFGNCAVIGVGDAGLADALPKHADTNWVELSPTRAASVGAEPAPLLDPLPLKPDSLDLVLSCLELHWANDLVGQLIQMRRALKPDGLMIAAMFGGQTLHELRAALAEAEVEISGGLRPRVAPMAELRDLGGLLQRAGFALPVADAERITADYADIWALMRDLRAMGETSILVERPRGLSARALFEKADQIYKSAFPTTTGRIGATFEIVYLTGWAPADTQPTPLRPGSASMRLADALDTVEHAAGEKAGPDAASPSRKPDRKS
ncbi:MAG: methyltransferase domain-containing protein [Paracoccaceae bacterium]